MNEPGAIDMFSGSEEGIVLRLIKSRVFAFARGERDDVRAILVHSARVFICLCKHSQQNILACHLNPHPHLSSKGNSTTQSLPKWLTRYRPKSSAPCVITWVFMLAAAATQSATAQNCGKKPTGHRTSCSANASRVSRTISAPSRTITAYTSAPSTSPSMAIRRSLSGCATLDPTNQTARS
jgi:hypothetical protein